MTLRHLLLAALALAFLIPSASAQDRTAAEGLTASETVLDAPTRFTYSGVLTDAEGAALADGPRALVFRGYASAEDARAGAAPTWEESHNAAVVGGRFLTVLGSQDDVPADMEYFTVSVDGEVASAPMRLDRGASAEGSFAPGNTLQDSYENGRIIDITGSAMQIRGALNSIGLIVRDITPVFTTTGLTRFRLTSTGGAGRIWEYRVYGASGSRPQGTFSIADATGGGSDALVMAPGVSEGVLSLAGNTASVGEAENPADLSVYSTANPADPSNGFVSGRIYDWFGEGASLSLYQENGSALGELQPDIDGEGGYFRVLADAGNAFTVDGNTGSGARITMAGGTTATVFDTGASGTSSVLLPTNAIQDTEILDEAGVSNNASGSPVSTPTGATVTISRSITAPTDGYVLAIATGELILNHTTGSTSTIQYSVTRDCDASPTAPLTQQTNYGLPTGAATGTYRVPSTVQGVFDVAAGTTTFCAYVNVTSGSASIDDQNISLIFVPTAYGSVVSNLTEGGVERDEAPVAGLSEGAIAAERAEAEQVSAARMRTELQEMEARLAEIQALLENGNSR